MKAWTPYHLKFINACMRLTDNRDKFENVLNSIQPLTAYLPYMHEGYEFESHSIVSQFDGITAVDITFAKDGELLIDAVRDQSKHNTIYIKDGDNFDDVHIRLFKKIWTTPTNPKYGSQTEGDVLFDVKYADTDAHIDFDSYNLSFVNLRYSTDKETYKIHISGIDKDEIKVSESVTINNREIYNIKRSIHTKAIQNEDSASSNYYNAVRFIDHFYRQITGRPRLAPPTSSTERE